MQFERIRKNHKRKIIIGGLILVCIISAITITTTRAKYKLTEDIPLVRGSINYKEPDMRLVAVSISEDGTNYNIVDEIPTSGYELNSEKSVCKVATESTGIENAPKDNNVTLEYVNGKVNIRGVTKKGTRCYLYFDKYVPPITIPDIIATLNAKTERPDFSKVATTDEGVYSEADGMYGGTSYYWRGAVTNNYVKFGGFCWRIIRINGDKTMRLIYDGTTCHANGTHTEESIAVASTKYNSSYSRSEYSGYTYTLGSQRTLNGTESNLKTQTEKWFNANITGTNANKVVNGKFCNDRSEGSGYSWSSQPTSTFNYFGYDRSGAKSASSVTPTLSCPSGDVYTLKAGAITMDEVIMAGGKWGTENSRYYLFNAHYYWAMTPYGTWANGTSWDASEFYVNLSGSLNSASVSNPWGLRPVINLRSDVTFSDGNGTQSSPYVVQ